MSYSTDLLKHPEHESVPGYWQRHRDAVSGFRGDSRNPHEYAMASMLRGWAAYADAHRSAYNSKIGDDGVLGEEWAAIGRALLGLLNGQLGRLDGGALDAFLRNTLHAEGFDPND